MLQADNNFVADFKVPAAALDALRPQLDSVLLQVQALLEAEQEQAQQAVTGAVGAASAGGKRARKEQQQKQAEALTGAGDVEPSQDSGGEDLDREGDVKGRSIEEGAGPSGRQGGDAAAEMMDGGEEGRADSEGQKRRGKKVQRVRGGDAEEEAGPELLSVAKRRFKKGKDGLSGSGGGEAMEDGAEAVDPLAADGEGSRRKRKKKKATA